MSKSINNNDIFSKDKNDREKNQNKNNILPSNEKEQKKSEKTIPNLNSKILANINLGKNNSLLERESIGQQNINSYHINEISKPINQKGLIFYIRKIRKRKKHDANSKDNIVQIIIRNFIDFFLAFINLAVKRIIKKEKPKIEKLKKEKYKEINFEEIQFKIGFVIKRKIKVKDILDLSVERLLNLDQERKIKNVQQNDNTSNKKRLIKIRTLLGSLLDNFLKIPVISLFREIYAKKKEKIDLNKYGIKGIVLKLPKNMKTFKKLKEKQRNRQKVQKMNKIIKSEFINPKKRRLRKIFKIMKKE